MPSEKKTNSLCDLIHKTGTTQLFRFFLILNMSIVLFSRTSPAQRDLILKSLKHGAETSSSEFPFTHFPLLLYPRPKVSADYPKIRTTLLMSRTRVGGELRLHFGVDGESEVRSA